MELIFEPGKNIAMKIPPHEYQDTLRFYRDVIRLKEIQPADEEATPRFEFGDKVLWLDCATGISQAEIWLEIITNDLARAAGLLEQSACHRRDEIEALPDGFQAFWLSSPANIIHLVSLKR